MECIMCRDGKNCYTYAVSATEVDKWESIKTYVCYKHYESYLKANKFDAVIESEIMPDTYRYPGAKRFRKAIIIADANNNLEYYSHKLNPRKVLVHEVLANFELDANGEKVYTNPSKKAYADRVVASHFNKRIKATRLSHFVETEIIELLKSPFVDAGLQDVYDTYGVKQLSQLNPDQAAEFYSHLKDLEKIELPTNFPTNIV